MPGLDEVIERVQGELTDSQQKALTLMAELRDLEEEKAALQVRLESAMRIKFFMPTAFEHGPCKVYPRGNANKPDDMKFIIETGDGIKHVWKLLEVPVELWEKWKPMFRKTCSMMRSPQVWRD